MILNIETSAKICSVALCENMETVYSLQSEGEMEHSTKLAPYVEQCMNYLRMRERELDAVAVSIGPGSYTGLRIGLSTAKGLCFSLSKPLIGINTLEILAVKALFKSMEWEGNELYVPMVDARRMEVYTAIYDAALKPLMEPQAVILEPNSFDGFKNRKLIFIGDAVEKAKTAIDHKDARWIPSYPLATDMNALAEKALREGKFLDLAYSTPFYIKNFQATTPKNKVLG